MTEPERPPEETVYSHIKIVQVPPVLALNERDLADFLAAWDEPDDVAWLTVAVVLPLAASVYLLMAWALR